jgi:hypothetical protein
MTTNQSTRRHDTDERASSAMPQLSWNQALGWRMARHHLIERAKPSDLVQVVSDLAGVHAQVKSSAELSLWARTDALQRDAVDEALWTNRTLV